ncbi:MAG: undecaprenyldiphospho-muramoylpentapeptide beta-N-acetylglucosaminyltransferase [Actinomycetota bacterium]
MVAPTRVVLAAGGTAGHVFPALAIRSLLVGQGAEVRLYCDERALAYVGDLDQSTIDVIPSGGLVTGSITKRVGNLFKLVTGSFAARRLLKEYRPELVIGLGGYASVGPVLAARHLGIPSVLHEQNSVMGAANKVTARSADAVALTFDPTEGARGATTVTGNPSRPEIVAVGDVPYPTVGSDSPIGILIMGGSQGARIVSERVPAALAGLPDQLRPRLRVVHQARPEDHDRVTAAYASVGIEATVEPFVDVPAALPEVHLVISRSGATTVCDMAVAGRPAIYLPLLSHRDLQQVKNAQSVVDAGGALLLREDETTTEDLGHAVASLLEDPARLSAMATAARAWSRPDASQAILDLLT